MVLPGNDLDSAVILDLRGSTWESLQVDLSWSRFTIGEPIM